MLASQDLAACSAALARAKAGAEEAERLAASANGWWSSVIGAESSAAALRTNAAAARTLYETLAAKLARWRSSPELVSAPEVASFVDAAGAAAENKAAKAAASLLTVTGAVKDVGAATARDLASPVRWPALAWVLIAAVLLVPLFPLLVLGRARA